jgi:hypothetical protein
MGLRWPISKQFEVRLAGFEPPTRGLEDDWRLSASPKPSRATIPGPIRGCEAGLKGDQWRTSVDASTSAAPQ